METLLEFIMVLISIDMVLYLIVLWCWTPFIMMMIILVFFLFVIPKSVYVDSNT